MNSGQNPKGYNNEAAWEKLEQADLKKKNKGYTVINPDMDIETIEPTIIDNSKDESFYQQNEDFGDVLQLTEYNEGGLINGNTDFVVAEYNKVDVQTIDKDQKVRAERFVNKITKFVLEFNDIKLTEDHQDYIKQVGELQLSNLQDLLSLVEINKQMIGNIVARVNAVQAEDYAIINAYNNLVNQHIKLIKEVSNTYKSIPSVIKKMRADVLSNQELEATTESDEVITEEFGEKQFNNSKQLLKSILAKRKQKQLGNEQESTTE